MPDKLTDLGEKRSTVVLRSKVKAQRAAARGAEIRRRREINNGASPELADPVIISKENEPTPPAEEMSEDFKKFVEAVNTKLDNLGKLPTAEQFEAFGCKIEKNTEEIASNAKKISDQDSRISRLTQSVEKLERENIDMRRGLDGKIKTVVEARSGTQDATRDEYNIARKSLRFWPIDGKSEAEMLSAARKFIESALQVRNYEEKVGRIIAIKRIPDREKSLIYSEVSVEFGNIKARDFLASRGTFLADFIDDQRKPTCGIRMEIPDSLMPTFRILKRYSFHLRKSNGRTKDHIKYDDFKRSLFMQVKLPDDEGEWLQVYPDEAHEILRQNDNKRNARLRSIGSPPENVQRRKVRRLSSSAATPVVIMETDEAPVGGRNGAEKEPAAWRPPARPSS